MKSSERRVIVGLGANLGDPRRTVLDAFDEIAKIEGVVEIARSRLYRTRPVGGPPQDDYVNAALALSTSLAPQAILAALQAIERSHGRTRGKERDLPRTLDLDILLIEGEAIDEPNLTVPHPRLKERAFAMIPLLEVAPDAKEPKTGLPYLACLEAVDRSGVVPID